MKSILFYFFTLCLPLALCQEPSMAINLNPPEENPKDTVAALKDIGKLEEDLRFGLDQDFDVEKKNIIDVQQERVHDIVHEAFLSLRSLVPNPIKAEIRKAVLEGLGGRTAHSQGVDRQKASEVFDNVKTNNDKLTSKKKVRVEEIT